MIRRASPWLEDAFAAARGELERCVRDLATLNRLAGAAERPAGKLLRPRLMLMVAAGHPRRPSPETAAAVAVAVELAHLATLHHDDVLDGSRRRRRSSSARQELGNKVSILFGDSLLVASLDLLTRHADRPMLRAVAKAVTATLQGEIRQHLHHRTPDLSERECLRVARLKTGSLFGLAGQLGVMSSEGGRDAALAVGRFGRALGTAYQLVDDLLDYEGTAESLGKPPGTDHREGIATLPLVRAWRKASAAERELLSSGFGRPAGADLGAVRELLRTLGGTAFCMARIHDALRRARASLAGLDHVATVPEILEYVDEIERRVPELPRLSVERRPAVR